MANGLPRHPEQRKGADPKAWCGTFFSRGLGLEWRGFPVNESENPEPAQSEVIAPKGPGGFSSAAALAQPLTYDGLMSRISPGASSAPQPSFDPSLSLALAVRVFGLLFGEGVSVGLGAWALAVGPDLVPYALDNRVSLFERKALLVTLFGAGALFVLAGAGYLGFRSRPTLRRLQQIALRLAPLFLVGFLPFLFEWRIWQSRELTYAVLVGVLGFALYQMLWASLRAEPLFAGLGVRWSGSWPRILKNLEPWLPILLVLLGVLGYCLYFSHHSIQNHRSLRSTSFDLGFEENLIWNLIHGGEFMKSSPLVGPVGSIFGDRATLFAYVVGLVYALNQRPETLLVIQSLITGLAAVPLFFLGRRYVGTWAATVLAFAYLLYPPIHAANVSGFGYWPFAVLFLWTTLHLLETRRYGWAALSMLLLLSVQKDASVALIVLGAYLIFSGRHPRAGLAVALLAALYLVVLKTLVLPRWHGVSLTEQVRELLPSREPVGGGFLQRFLANPLSPLASLLEEQKLLRLLEFGAPLALFPWQRPIGWLLGLPILTAALLAPGYLPPVASWAPGSALLFVAVLANLAQTRKAVFAGDTLGAKRQHAWVATIALLTLITSHQWGGILQQNTLIVDAAPYRFGTTAEDRARAAKLKSWIARIPPRAKVASSDKIVPQLANRPDAYTLRLGIFDADYLLALLPASDEESVAIRKALASDFGVLQVDPQFLIAKRGHSKSKNAQGLSLLAED